MRIGYVQINQKKQSGHSSADILKKAACDYVYIDSFQAKKEVWQKRPELISLIQESNPGDVIVMADLDQLSPHYQVWLEFLTRLKNYKLELEILAVPKNSVVDWLYFFSWMKKQAEAKLPGVRVKKFSKEHSVEKSQYHFFSRDPYFRQSYRTIFQKVAAKQSLREITRQTTAPLGTVVRIKKDYEKLKQTVLFVGTFLLTIISLKMVQQYSSNTALQVLICGIMTLLVVYFTYSDSQSE